MYYTQKESRLQEFLYFDITNSLDTFSITLQLDLEERKTSIVVTKLGVYNSVFKKRTKQHIYNIHTRIPGRPPYC